MCGVNTYTFVCVEVGVFIFLLRQMQIANREIKQAKRLSRFRRCFGDTWYFSNLQTYDRQS